MLRKTINVFGIGLLTLFVAGCGNTAVTPAPTSEPTPEPTPVAQEVPVVAPEPTPESAPTESAPVKTDLIVAMTTSIEDSGLLDVLVPVFEQETGYSVKPLAVGSGQALGLAAKGEADVLFICAPEAERAALSQGTIINRALVMHDHFMLVGPADDPAQIRGKPVAEALELIAESQALFLSRGDDSGTNKKELSLWQLANTEPAGDWYQETGAGMGKTLQITDERQGYTLVDSATYFMQKKNLPQMSLEVLVEGEDILLNLYSVMEVNPEQFPQVNQAGAAAFRAFLLSTEGQKLIADHGKDDFPEPLFVIDGGKTDQEYGL